MISRRELDALSGEWSLDIGVIEKDYVLGWLLAGAAQHADLARTWIFKGGTCLRKCYYETFRFSEDLDFTVIDGGPEDVEDLQRIFGDVAGWIREESGIELVLVTGRSDADRTAVDTPPRRARSHIAARIRPAGRSRR